MASSAKNWRWLVEWIWPSATYRYASSETVTHDGHTWENRVLKIDGLGGQYIDSKEAEFGDLSVKLCNLADDGSTSFPFHLLDAADDFEDKEIRVYLYDATADTKTLEWFGITKRPDFDPEELTCTIPATFPWDAIDIKIPTIPLGHLCPYAFGGSSYETAGGTVPSPGCQYATYGTPGFTSCGKTFADCEDRGMLAFFGGWTHIAPTLHDDVNNLVDRDKVRAGVVPLVYGTGDLKIKPEVYRAVIRESELIVDFIISGTHNGLPFDASQIDASRLKLGGVTRASAVEFYTGVVNQAIPGNRTLFPEAVGHSFVAYGAARFPLTKEQIDKYSDNVPFHAVRARIDGGRKTLRSSGQTENPVYVLEDVLRDPIYGLGLPVSQIDSSAVTSAASFVGARFRGRFEIDRPEPLIDWVQRMCATAGLFLTWNDGLMQIGAKRDTESAVATFGTGGGRKIIDHDAVRCTEESFSDLVNDLVVRYRAKMRQKREFAYADYGAQIKAGNGLKKVITEELFLEGIYDDDEAAIAAAVWLRQEQNLNLTIEFKTPLDDWVASGAQAGKVIRVNSPHIWNNASNYLFRVTGFDVDTEAFIVTVRGRIYKGSVYAYNADPIDGDILRDGGDTSIAARPPDVTSVAAAIADVFTDDDDDRMARIHGTWTYPDVSADHTQDNAEGIYPEYPIEAVKLYWRYTDESINDLKLGARVQYPTAAADIVVPFHRSRQVEVWFVAVGRNNGQGALGYVIDPAQTTFLDGDLNSTAPTFDVGSTAAITATEYLRCESELMLVSSVSSPSVTVADSGGNRTPQFDTDAESHPDGTEIGVAVKSHPTATVDMASRRYTLPVVTGIVTRSRPRGVRVKWTNLPDYDAEKYFLYWSVTGDLETSDPWVTDWLTEDPKAPPAGIELIKCGKKAHHLIPQEDIDAAYAGIGPDATGIPVVVRVAAKIKNNYSNALSALPHGTIPGHHNRPIAPPADPIAGDISQDVIATSDRVRVTVRVYATSDRTTGTPRTWDDVNAHIAGLVFEKFDKVANAWSGVFEPEPKDIEDPTSSFQDITRTFHKGSRWRIRKAFSRNPGTKRSSSALVLLEFRAGSVTDVLTGITGLTIAAFGSNETTNSIEHDGNGSQLLCKWTQPNPAVVLRELQVRKKQSTAAKWRRVPAVQLLDRVDDNGVSFNTNGAKEVRVDVNHPHGVNMDFEIRLVGADGDVTAWVGVNRDTSSEFPDNPATAAAAPTILKATIGPAGLNCRCSKPTDERPYLQRYEYQFSNATSGAGTDWLNPDTGAVALLNTNPTAGDVALASATFTGDKRFTAPDLQKRDLDVAFKNGTAQGVLALFVRARVVDLDDDGNDRVGTWSSFTAVTHRHLIDIDADTRTGGRGNLIDGGGCFASADLFTPALGTSATIGRRMALTPAGGGTLITTSTTKVQWDKTNRCLLVINTTSSNSINIRVFGVLFPGEIYWLTFAGRAVTATTSPGNIVVAAYDAGAAVSKGAVNINRAWTTTYDLIGVRLDLTSVTAWTGNPWIILQPPTSAWTGNNLAFTHFCLTRGPRPQLWEPGAQEKGIDAASGVGLADNFGLGALGMAPSLNAESITTWGVLQAA